MMKASASKPWIRAAILVGVAYFVVGMVFGALAKPAATDQVRFMWRLAAWVASAGVFAAHIGYEHFRTNNSPRPTARHAAMAVALGAFLLALAANIHDLGSPLGYRPRMLIALIAGPLLTGAPAFLVALAAAAVLARLPTKRLTG
jgi:peptidoglycan/LPS O-acetylase OafA/YrhL